MNYVILTSTTPADLEKKVSEHLSNGYQLVGGISISIIHTLVGDRQADIFWYAQALVI